MAERILLVDDDDAFRYAAAKLLSNAGYETSDAPDFRRALEILDEAKPLNLLLTDLMMPGVNGFALARMARMRHPGLKVIYMTAFDVPTREAVGPVLRKPIDAGLLLAEARKALEVSEERTSQGEGF